MAAAATLNIENWLSFLYYCTNPYQIRWWCWEFDIKRNYGIEIAYLPKFKMAATASFNFENRSPCLYYRINPHQIWWECWESAVKRNCHMRMHIYKISRWRKPPSRISKIGCHFFTIESIFTKFGENVEDLTQNATTVPKCIFTKI